MAKRTIHVIMSNTGGELDRRTFTYDDDDDLQDGGAAARDCAEEMIRQAGYLNPGDTIQVVEG